MPKLQSTLRRFKTSLKHKNLLFLLDRDSDGCLAVGLPTAASIRPAQAASEILLLKNTFAKAGFRDGFVLKVPYARCGDCFEPALAHESILTVRCGSLECHPTSKPVLVRFFSIAKGALNFQDAFPSTSRTITSLSNKQPRSRHGAARCNLLFSNCLVPQELDWLDSRRDHCRSCKASKNPPRQRAAV